MAERRFAPKKVEIQVDRFEVNLGKDAILVGTYKLLDAA